MNKINIDKLKPKTINMLRDMAAKIEKNDLTTAYELMSLAYRARPNGLFIKEKVEEYSKELFALAEGQKILKEKIDSEEVVIIPIGFRCYTKLEFRKKIGLSQESFVFDSGFFPPASVASVFKDPRIHLEYGNDSQTVCIKYENHNDSEFGRGIKFQKSNYAEINSIVSCREFENINMYLDSARAYYTLDTKHNFILAHYNWHQLADQEKSKGITDPKINLQNINDMLNRRIERMLKKCNKAKHIFFIHLEHQGYNYMMIDNNKFELNDFQDVLSIANDMFDAKIHIVDVNKINNIQYLLNIIEGASI